MATRIEDSLVISAFRRKEISRFPVWMMRQAGRYQASYRALREKNSLLELVKTPELAAKVTLNAVSEFGFDAAIIFSDILIVLEALGLDLEFVKGEGPKLSAIREEADFQKLRTPDPEEAFSYTLSAISLTQKELAPQGVPLIGFVGAPFTLAMYAIEGGGSRDYLNGKKLLHARPDLFERLSLKLVDTTAGFLKAQVKAGADAVQIFDSWAGILSPTDYQKYALPYAKLLIEKVRDCNVPVVYFSTGTSSYLDAVALTHADVIGVDWRADLGASLKSLPNKAVQGNLDPSYLFAPWDVLKAEILRVHAAAKANAHNSTGFVFNLGHGIMQHTPEDNVKRAVELVKSL